MNKRGSQTGMIISFTLFVVSLVFIYFIIGSPIKFPNQKQSSLNLLEKNVLLQSKNNFIVERIYSNNSNCLETPLPTSFNKVSTNSAIALGGTSNLNCSIVSGKFQTKPFNGEIKVYYPSNDFNSSLNCSANSLGDCNETTINSISYEKHYTQKKIMRVINQSENNNTNYSSILGVSESENYNIRFIYQNGTIIGKQIEDKIKTPIYSTNIQIYYLDLSGKEKRGTYILQIW